MWRPPQKIKWKAKPGEWPTREQAAASRLFSTLEFGAVKVGPHVGPGERVRNSATRATAHRVEARPRFVVVAVEMVPAGGRRLGERAEQRPLP